MSAQPEGDIQRGRPALEISNGMVQILSRVTGRGPTKARTTIARDHVVVMLRDTLTRGEQELAAGGYGEQVLNTRALYQRLMRDDAVALVERVLGREVIGFMSDNHLDPDLGAEMFVLGPGGDDSDPPSEADSAD